MNVQPSLPMLSAQRLAEDLRQGRVSAEEIMDRARKAIERRERQVRAFACRRLPAAEDAIDLGAGPLAGLPFAVKDTFDTSDFATGYGSAIYADHHPDRDAEIVGQTRRAGAILIGKTVATEFSLFRAGPTTNPHDRARTPGGSSSGSAAAVAAGMVAFALGAQTAGSVIRPAAFCGVAAFKPSFGLLSTVGTKPVAPSLDTIGLFAASVRDVAFVAAALGVAPGKSTKPPRIALCAGWHGAEPADAARDAIERAGAAARAGGALVTPIALPAALEDLHQDHAIVMVYEAAISLAYEMEMHGERLSPRLAAYLEDGLKIDRPDYQVARARAAEMRRQARDWLGDFDILLTPSAPGPAPLGLEDTGSSAFNEIWTLLHLPVVNIPGLETPDGLPLGIQAIGLGGDDRTALTAAAFLEDAIRA